MSIERTSPYVAPSRRTVLGGMAGAAASLVYAPHVARASSLKPITFQLDWIAYGRHAPYYVALEKGFYATNGLDVTIQQGTGVADGMRNLAAGKSHFNFNDIGSMIAIRSREGVKIKAVACMYQHSPHTMFFLKNKGINSPKDIEGRTIGSPSGTSPKVMFPAFASANGIDQSKIQWISTDPNSMNALLMAHRADSVITYIFTLPVLENAAQNGDEVGYFTYSDYGADFYANAILGMEDYIAQNPDTVRAFTTATVKGFEYTLANPAEAVSIMMKYQPQLNEQIALKEIPLLQKLSAIDAETKGFGGMTLEKMARTEELTARCLNLTERLAPADLFTNEFLA
jgi:NitT/TauT family transport system substrate-binding protein